MNRRPTLPLLLLAAVLLALAAAPASAASKAKAPKPNAAIARQIAALERTTNTLSSEVAALTAETATLEGSVRAPLAPALAGAPMPAPEAPAGGSFGGTFPNPRLLPESIGAGQLGEGSVTADKIVDGGIQGGNIAAGAIRTFVLGELGQVDMTAALTGRTLERRSVTPGESLIFELGVPREQTLTPSAHCAGRTIGGGWKLVPGSVSQEVMASVPAFVGGGLSTEHDWIVTVHEEQTNTTVRERLDTFGLCIR